MARRLTIPDVVITVARFYRIHPGDIMAMDRTRLRNRARKVAMYLGRELTGMSYPELGREFYRDHTTVLEACRSVQTVLDEEGHESKLWGEVESCRRRLCAVWG